MHVALQSHEVCPVDIHHLVGTYCTLMMIMTLSNMVPMRVLVAQEELQGELEQELERYGIQPEATGMSDQQYSDAMADLQQRREQMLAGKTPTERRRILAMRNTMMWHLNNVSATAATDAMLCSSAVLCCAVRSWLCCAVLQPTVKLDLCMRCLTYEQVISQWYRCSSTSTELFATGS